MRCLSTINVEIPKSRSPTEFQPREVQQTEKWASFSLISHAKGNILRKSEGVRFPWLKVGAHTPRLLPSLLFSRVNISDLKALFYLNLRLWRQKKTHLSK